MQTKKISFTAISIFYVLLFTVNIFAISKPEKVQTQFFGTSTLTGLKGILVSISFLKAENVNCNLPLNDIQTEIELYLRRNGIPFFVTTSGTMENHKEKGFVADQNEANAFALKHNLGMDFGTLDIQVCVRRSGSPAWESYEVRTDINFSQLVSLVRNQKIRTFAITWPYSSLKPSVPIAFYESTDLEKGIREEVRNKLAEFCNDYLAANPKDSSPKENISDSNNK
ncbi:MAG: hypothetical protein LLF92_09210 [Planctomycetaceae bacterium]|nr:hypothetical protein [Planctomycetaceae bacterium]